MRKELAAAIILALLLTGVMVNIRVASNISLSLK